MNPQPCPPHHHRGPRCWLHHPPVPHLLTINWSQCMLLGLPALPRSVLAADRGSSQSLWETWPGGQQLHPSPGAQTLYSLPRSPCKTFKFQVHDSLCEDVWAFILSSLSSLSLPPVCPCSRGDKTCLPSKQKGIREVAPHSLSVSSKPNSNSLLKDLTCDIEKI